LGNLCRPVDHVHLCQGESNRGRKQRKKTEEENRGRKQRKKTEEEQKRV
jgi:hypothetical protein